MNGTHVASNYRKSRTKRITTFFCPPFFDFCSVSAAVASPKSTCKAHFSSLCRYRNFLCIHAWFRWEHGLYCLQHSLLGSSNHITIHKNTQRQDRQCTRWFKYDRDDLCVNKSQFVPVIFEPPCTYTVTLRSIHETILAVEKQ